MQNMISFWLFLILQLTFTPLLSSADEKINFHHRRILHHPFFPDDSLPPTAQPPVQQQQPKHPFSTLSPPNNNNNQVNPFFPAFPSPPPPPPVSSVPTFPANISSIIFPRPSSSSKPISRKLIVVAVTLSLVSAALVTAIAAFLIHHRRHRGQPGKVSRTESLRLFPPNTDSSDGSHKTSRNVAGTSTEFLYPGTARGIDDEEQREPNPTNPSASSVPGYQKLGSPELRPLPPLPRHNYRQSVPQVGSGKIAGEGINNEDEGEEEFFSPRASSSGKGSPEAFQGVENRNFGSRSLDSRTASYPSSHSVSPNNSMSSSPFVPLHLSPRSLRSKSPDSVVDFPPPSRPPPAIPPRIIDQPPTQGSTSAAPTRLPPSPPPLPPPRFWETEAVQVTIQDQMSGPPTHVAPTRPPVVMQNHTEVLSAVDEAGERTGETSKPKLKPLHWDKVRASSDRAMVWDQLKSSSFQLNEEMIETLFMVNSSSHLGQKDGSLRPMPQIPNQENRVLDPKKSQNIAILLRALNVTIEEVCEALLEGSTDTLGTELLESLLKMAPTKEEERKLKEFNDQSPFKLGPAEKFLKAVLDIPFAFQRVEAMLYIANFDSEVDYLRKSFETIEVACEELRNNRMFLKLLEAVLKTGNRMNVGTNRGDAEAFKLDTLLKLVDIKGTDGKTTLLHFVVQEISRAEGCRLANADYRGPDNDQSSFQEDIEFRKQGLQVVSGLSSELSNVKKAAAMDSETLSNDASKLWKGLVKIREVLNEETAARGNTQKFSESMIEFLKKAEAEIVNIQGKERVSVSLVKEITEYFHGNSAKEEAHPFRIFTVVRDFISVLDRVCKEVGKINERSLVSSTRQFPPPVNSTQLPVFPELNMKQQFSSSDDESSSSSS